MIKNKKFEIDLNNSYRIINGMKQYGKFRLYQILSDGTKVLVMESWTLGTLMEITKGYEVA